LPLELFTLPFEEVLFSWFTSLLNADGFVKSSYAALPFTPRRGSGALPAELFTLPFENAICTLYKFTGIDGM